MAKGNGFHVEEADVHLGLDINPLPDLEQTEELYGCPHSHQPPARAQSSALSPPAHRPPLPPAEPLQAGENQGAVFREDELSEEVKLPSVFLLMNLALTFGFFLRLSQQVMIKSQIRALCSGSFSLIHHHRL